jgi:hypothetical protein
MYIQIAVDKNAIVRYLYLTLAQWHNPAATMGHSVHNVDICKPLAHTTPYTLSAICLVQLKPGIQTLSTLLQWPTEVCYNTELQSGQDPGEDDAHTDELLCGGF